jgi:chromate transporter
VLLVAGALAAGLWAVRSRTPPSPRLSGWLPLSPLGLGLGAVPLALPHAVGTGPLFWVFLKIGSLVFGSGYVLLAFLRAELVVRRGWLSEGALLDAVAAGQVTPGPLFTTASFIGYLLGRGWGAVVATAGIFLPAFVLVGVSAPFLPRLRRWPVLAAFLDGVNVASLALMTLVTWQLGRAALVDPLSVGLAAGSAALLMIGRVPPLWLIGAGALAGLARALF